MNDHENPQQEDTMASKVAEDVGITATTEIAASMVAGSIKRRSSIKSRKNPDPLCDEKPSATPVGSQDI